MPGLLSLFRGARPRQFEFRSRYYNADQEELNSRVRSITREVEEERHAAATGTTLTRAKLEQEWKRNRLQRSNSDYSKRMVIISVVLAGVVTALYLTVY